MANKKPKSEETVSKLQQVVVLTGQNMSRLNAIRQIGVVEQTDRCWSKCLAIRVERKLNSTYAIDALTDPFILRGAPGFVCSDNGPEFFAKAIGDWTAAFGAKTAYIELGITASVNAPMACSGMSCSTVKSSAVCANLKFWSNNGKDTTTQNVSTAH